MSYYFSRLILCLCFASMAFGFSHLIMRLITKSHKNFLPFIFVKAEKSPTNANLLGGLGLTVSILAALGSFIFFFPSFFSRFELFAFKSAIIPVLTVSLYGYMDDKYEIRARHKLIMQVLAAASFVGPIAIYFHPHSPVFALVSFIFGMAYINGCNLIDGLDTLFAKLGTIASVGYLFLGLTNNSFGTVTLSLTVIGSLAAFYRFNREPAKIYAGEIGGSLLGILFYVQGHMLFNSATHETYSFRSLEVFFTILMVSMFPLAELGVTFCRRLFFKRSPFRGDHLHLHHIIKAKFRFNATKTSNVIAMISLGTTICALSLRPFMGPIPSFSVALGIFCSTYLAICFSYWRTSYSSKISNEIFMSLEEKPIHVIDGKYIDSLYLEYVSLNASTSEKKAS